MAGRSQANAVRLASRAEVPICLFLNRFGWFLARIPTHGPQISNPSPLSQGSVLKSYYFKVCQSLLLWSTSIIGRYVLLVGTIPGRFSVCYGKSYLTVFFLFWLDMPTSGLLPCYLLSKFPSWLDMPGQGPPWAPHYWECCRIEDTTIPDKELYNLVRPCFKPF